MNKIHADRDAFLVVQDIVLNKLTVDECKCLYLVLDSAQEDRLHSLCAEIIRFKEPEYFKGSK